MYTTMTKDNVSLRLEPTTRDRIEAVNVKLTARAGVEVGRSTVLRAIVDRGLDEMERELGIKRAKR